MIRPIYIALIVIAIAIEAVFTPLFLKAQRPGKNSRSLVYKMICATMFVLVGIFAFLCSGNRTEFAKYMLIGLALSWVGDLFLHIPGKSKWTFTTGLISFASAHVFYLIAYESSYKMLFPDKKFFTLPEIIAVIALEVGISAVYVFVKKMNFKSMGMALSAVYGIVLNAMLVKAIVLSASYAHAGLKNSVPIIICIAFGAFCFFLSDTTLAVLMFNEPDKNNYSLKNHNIATYFLAQTLLALSVLFLGV